jgi:hypothetical protein
MAVSQGFLILCSKTKIWYTDLVHILSLKIEAMDSMEYEADLSEWSFEQITITKRKGQKSSDLDDPIECYNIMGINDLGEGNAALIVEEVEDNFLIFFRMDFKDDGKNLEIDLIENAPTNR